MRAVHTRASHRNCLITRENFTGPTSAPFSPKGILPPCWRARSHVETSWGPSAESVPEGSASSQLALSHNARKPFVDTRGSLRQGEFRLLSCSPRKRTEEGKGFVAKLEMSVHLRHRETATARRRQLVSPLASSPLVTHLHG